jgi:hypothetical protein
LRYVNICYMNVTKPVPDQATQTSAPELKPEAILNFTQVNESVAVRDDPELGWRVVLVRGIPYASYRTDDAHSERFACVRLRLDGFAEQLEIVRVFGHSRMTQHRWERKYLQGGLPALAPYRPAGRPVSIPQSLEDMVVRLHGQGCGMRRIAGRLGLSMHIVGGVYQRRGLRPQGEGEQQSLVEVVDGPYSERAGELPGDGAQERDAAAAMEAEEGEVELAEDDETPAEGAGWFEPWDGLLVPEHETATGVTWAGVLLAIPVMRRQRVVEVFSEVYKTLGLFALYGLQTMVSLMVFLALWRIKRPEQLKGYSPGDLGRSLGLERVPEVKTVRRKLAKLAGRGVAREAMLKLAKVRVEQEEELVGYLYVDGHVRPYNGRHDLAKGYSMQRHMPVRATTDTWVNDSRGDPLFFVTSEINEGLTQTLKPALEQARELVGDDRRLTVIFDRGGYSPQLFVRLIQAGYDIITYRKGRTKEIAVDEFEERVLEVNGKKTTYHLNDQSEVRIGSEKLEWSDGEQRLLTMRQVTRRKPDNGHQTNVLTNRTDLEPEQVLWRMFNRWRQENFFKYMRQEFAIDGLVEYGCEGVDARLERPNPEHHAVSREIAVVQARLKTLQSQRCELIGERISAPETRGGFERFVPELYEAGKLLGEIRQLGQHIQELQARKCEIPERISAGDLERLKTERQQVATLFKIAAYNVETELVRMVAPHYARTEFEGRKLIAAALRSSADLEVVGKELRVTLAPQSSPHRSRAVAALCTSLNKVGAVVPGTELRLVLDCAVQPPPDVTSPA